MRARASTSRAFRCIRTSLRARARRLLHRRVRPQLGGLRQRRRSRVRRLGDVGARAAHRSADVGRPARRLRADAVDDVLAIFRREGFERRGGDRRDRRGRRRASALPEGPEIRRSADAIAQALVGQTDHAHRVPRSAPRTQGSRVERRARRARLQSRQGAADRVRQRHHALQPQPALRRVGSHAKGRPTRTTGRTVRVVIGTRDAHGDPVQRHRRSTSFRRATSSAIRTSRRSDPTCSTRPRRLPSCAGSSTTARFRGRSLASLLLDQRFAAGPRQLPAQRHPVRRGPSRRRASAGSRRRRAQAARARDSRRFAAQLSNAGHHQRSRACAQGAARGRCVRGLPLPRLRPRRRAVLGLRHVDRATRRRRSRRLPLRTLPAGAAKGPGR